MPRRPSRPAAVALALGCLAAPGACGGADERGSDGGRGQAATTTTVAGSGCGRDVEEALDPGSTKHLLPGAPEPVYAGDPPTSGPHLAGATVSGVQAEPLPRTVQVAVLEAGGVLLQHRGLAPPEREQLERLAGDRVVVAPNPKLSVPVVATAWRHRLTCDGVDRSALDAFIAAHRGQGPQH